jgi:hypothetical protein
MKARAELSPEVRDPEGVVMKFTHGPERGISPQSEALSAGKIGQIAATACSGRRFSADWFDCSADED